MAEEAVEEGGEEEAEEEEEEEEEATTKRETQDPTERLTRSQLWMLPSLRTGLSLLQRRTGYEQKHNYNNRLEMERGESSL